MTLDRGVGHRGHARLGQDPQRVLLAGRLDQPGDHELAEDLVNTVEPVQTHRLPGRLQSLQENPHPVGGDRRHTSGPGRCRRTLSRDVRTAQTR